MNSVTSKDGTVIAYDRIGQGAPMILVTGALVDHQSHPPLVDALKPHFTVFNFDRRGRGDSGDTQPYTVEREIEDLDAVIGAAGGSAFVVGFSSGAALSLKAAASGLAIRKLVLWEAPFIVEGTRPRPPIDNAKTLTDLLAAGRRGDAVEFFLVDVVGLPKEAVAEMRRDPSWAAQEALAHTLIYDTLILGDYSLPTGSAAQVKVPTLVSAGSAFPWIRGSARALAKLIPGANAQFLDGQEHHVDPEVLTPMLVKFFKS